MQKDKIFLFQYTYLWIGSGSSRNEEITCHKRLSVRKERSQQRFLMTLGSGGPLCFWPKKRSVAALFLRQNLVVPLRCATALLAAKTAPKPL
jgi:hypothetical protein